MSLTIRRATLQDAQGIVDVINSVIEEGALTALYPPLTLAQEEAFVEGLGPRSALLVAETNKEIVGTQTIEPFAPYTRATDHVAVIGTFVRRDFRGQGIGRRLIEATLDFARENGYEKFVIQVRAENAVAQAFYRKMGFVPKMLLERQVKVEGKYDDQVLMEMFIPQPEEATATVAEPQAVAEPAAPLAPDIAVPSPLPSEPVVDPVVGAVVVRRAKRQDIKTLAAIMKGTMHWRPPPTQEEVLEMLFDKGYWLAMSRKGGGLTGWRAENLVMCIDDFYVYPPQYYPQVGSPLLETVEAEAKALSCEVAIAFLEKEIAPQAIQFFESKGYERQELDQLFSVWRQTAQEFLANNRFMMVKELLETRIMRPL